jgi:RNA polymerase sigma-70 factor (ECF subfamily)
MTTMVNKTIAHLRRAVLGPDGGGLSDGQLLACFVDHRDDAAFEALVRRLGPMVLGVCRRVIGNDHDAEDAFQAAFLVLVRKAATIVPREAIANWLYGVAYQTARKGRAMAVKRRAREKQVAAVPEPGCVAADPWSDLQPLLDQELSRLPDKYRLPVVLCDLQGKTRKDAAGQLGWPEGSLSGRLSRARALLAQRLTRRGVVISATALAAALGQNAASASVPAAVLLSTLHAAKIFAAGSAAGAVSSHAAVLAEGVLKAMLIAKLKVGALVLVVCGLIAAGGSLAYSEFGSQSTDDRAAGGLPAPAGEPPQSGKPVTQERPPQTLTGRADEPAEDRAPDDLQRLQGAWESASSVRNGEVSGPVKLVIERDGVLYPPSEVAERITALRGGTPRQIDLTVMSGPKQGRVYAGIYKLEKLELTICLDTAGKGRPSKFESPNGSGLALTVLKRQTPGASDGPKKATETKTTAPDEGDYIKAEVRGVMRLDVGDRAGGYVLVRRDNREDKVWFWFSEGEWKRWRDVFPKLAGAEVIVRGRIAQMPAGSMASVPAGALHFVGALEIESPPGKPR